MKTESKHRGKQHFPGVIISALRGGSGKTVFSVGIIAALHEMGMTVAPFKKGPDYIDAGWLAMAAGRPCYNLDTFLIDSDTILRSFISHSQGTDLAVIEGNRGLYDSIDRDGSTSTAELAKLLNLPVLLCIDGTKTTRTMAAVVSGLIDFDPDVEIRGVVLNQVAGNRHESNLTRCIEHYCRIPVLGAVPKLKTQAFPERHMGLVPTPEHTWAHESIRSIAEVISTYLDLNAVARLAGAGVEPGHHGEPGDREAPLQLEVCKESDQALGGSARVCGEPLDTDNIVPKIGIIRDSAFQFYYPENIEALQSAGAELVFTSPLEESEPPVMDGLYIGGGFPETHAEALSRNVGYREHLKALGHKGLPIYAECGGLMYLGKELVMAEGTFPMVGIFPLTFTLHPRPQGHGYTVLQVIRRNPYFEIGAQIKGHEFHYSRASRDEGGADDFAFEVKRGAGLADGRDGICFQNVLATYTHIHALGTPAWAKAMVAAAHAHRAAANKTP